MVEHESGALPSMGVRELRTDEAAESLHLVLLSGGEGLVVTRRARVEDEVEVDADLLEELRAHDQEACLDADHQGPGLAQLREQGPRLPVGFGSIVDNQLSVEFAEGAVAAGYWNGATSADRAAGLFRLGPGAALADAVADVVQVGAQRRG